MSDSLLQGINVALNSVVARGKDTFLVVANQFAVICPMKGGSKSGPDEDVWYCCCR